MTDKEKQTQRALGLEKGFITRISVEIPTWVSLPVLVKGFSEDEVRERMFSLSDNEKRKLIHHICASLMSDGVYDGYIDNKYLGEEVVDEIQAMANRPIRDLDPKDLCESCVEIDADTGVDTVDEAKTYITEELGIDVENIYII